MRVQFALMLVIVTAFSTTPTAASVDVDGLTVPVDVTPALVGPLATQEIDALAILLGLCDAIAPGSLAEQRAPLCADLHANAASPASLDPCFADESPFVCLEHYAIDSQAAARLGTPIDHEVGAAGESGFAAGCYISDLRIALAYAAFGCSAAATFSAQASFDLSFLLWTYSFDMGVAAAGCGGLAAGTTGYAPHVLCQGEASAGSSATFSCSDEAGLVSSYVISCLKVGFAAGDTECSEASATGHASNLPLTIEMHEAHASGASGKCEETVLSLLRGTTLTTATPPQRIFLPGELPAEVVEQVRANLVANLYSDVDAALTSGEYTPFESLMLLQMASDIEQELQSFEFPPLVGSLKAVET